MFYLKCEKVRKFYLGFGLIIILKFNCRLNMYFDNIYYVMLI